MPTDEFLKNISVSPAATAYFFISIKINTGDYDQMNQINCVPCVFIAERYDNNKR